MAVETLIDEKCCEHNAVIFTDGSAKSKRREKSGRDYTVRVNEVVVAEGSGAVEITTFSMHREVKVSEGLL